MFKHYERNINSVSQKLAKSIFILLNFWCISVFAGNFNIGSVDGSFETDLNGFVVQGDVNLVSSLGVLSPTQGDSAVLLTTKPDQGSQLLDIDESLLRIVNFIVPADASTLRLDYNFLTDESIPSYTNDNFNVKLVLISAGGEEQLLKFDTYKDFYDAPWTGYAKQSGFRTLVADISSYAGNGEQFTLEIRVADVGDGRRNSAVFLDNLRFSNEGEPITESTFVYKIVDIDEKILFDASGSTDDSNIVEYRWIFGNGTIGIGRLVEYAFPEDGIYQVRLLVTDDEGNITTKDIQVVVGEVNHAPEITSTANTVAVENISYQSQVVVSDPELSYGDIINYSLLTAPDGMTIDADTGLITWLPTSGSARKNTVTVEVTDSFGLTDSQTYALTIGAETFMAATVDDGRVYFARSNGDGSFSGFQQIGYSGSGSRGTVVADFDGDGDFDIISGRSVSSRIHLYLYQREGNQFLAPAYLGQTGSSTYPGGSYLMDMAAEDFNNDGNMDYVVNGNNANTWMYQNKGSLNIVNKTFFESGFELDDGTWAGAQCSTGFSRDDTTKANGSYSMRVFATADDSCMSIDINPSSWNLHDGTQVTFSYRVPPGVPAGLLFRVGGKDWIYVGGSSAASSGSEYTVPASHLVNLINDDQWHTVTIDLYNAIRQVWPDATTITEFEWWSDTKASIGEEFWFDDFNISGRVVESGFTEKLMPNGGGSGRGMDAADVDADGNMDFVRARYSDAKIYLYSGDGNGDFTISSSAIADPGSDNYGVVLGDFDSDGIIDLISNNGSSGDPYFYKGKNNGAFFSGVYIGSLDVNNHVSYGVYDFNNDGKLDIVAATYTSRQIWFYSGNGDASFGARVLIGTTPVSVLSVAAPAGRKIGQPFSRFVSDKELLAEGGSVHFDATNSYDDGSIVQYLWTFGDGSTATGAVVDHVFSAEGNEIAILTVVDEEGNKDVSSKVIVVTGQAPVANAGNTYEVSEDKAIKGEWPILLDGSASTDQETSIIRYEWDFDSSDGVTVDATGARPIHIYSAVGSYTVSLTVYDEVNQSHTVTTTVDVLAEDKPQARINGPTSIDETSASLGEWTAIYDFGSANDDLGISQYDIDWGDGSTAVINSLKENFEENNLASNPKWTITRGDWQVKEGELQQTIVTDGNWLWLQDLTQSYTDFEMELDFKAVGTTDGYMGIVFHNKNTSASTDSFLMYSRNSWNFWRFYDWKTGGALQDGGNGWDPDTWYHLRLLVIGNNMKLFVTKQGGVEELQLDIDNPNHSEGGIGLLALRQSLIYDNVSVVPVAAALKRGHTYSATGDYDISLTVTDHANQIDNLVLTTQVSANDTPISTHGGPYILDESDANNGVWDLILNMTGSTDDHNIQRYQIDFGDGTSYTTGFNSGKKGSYFATGTDLYGFDVPEATLGRIIATEDNTFVQLINLETNAVISTKTLNRFGTWNVNPGVGVYFKVKATKPVIAYETDFGAHSAFIPSMGASPVGNEFVFYKQNSSVFYVYAYEESIVRFLDSNGSLAAEKHLKAGSYWNPTALAQKEYRVVSSGKVAIQTAGNTGYTTVPSETGDGAGKLFYFATNKGTTGAYITFAHEDTDVEVFDMDSGELLFTQTIIAGESWYQNNVGSRRLKLVSTGFAEVWSGDTEAGTGIINLGDDISMAGGKDGKEFYLHNLQDGIVIFSPNKDTEINIDNGSITKTLGKDQFLHLSPLDFPTGSGVHHIVASEAIVIQTLGRSNVFNDMGSYLGGVSARHDYTAVGVYPLKVTAIDNAGQTHTVETTVTVKVNEPPVADIAAPETLSEGIAVGGKWPVDFDASGSTDDFGIRLYEWDFGDGNTGSGLTVHHEYLATGTYEVTLTVTDHVGQQTVKTFSITVEASNNPVADAGGPYVFSEESASYGVWTATLDGTASTDDSGIFDYVWEFDAKIHDFSGTELNTEEWLVSAGVTQDDAISVVGASSWSNRYIFSKKLVDRKVGDTFIAQVLPVNTSGNQQAMWGFKNASTSNFSYTQMPYAIYFTGSSILIYENGSSRGSKATYTRGVLYDIRITLKETGAVYEFKQADQTDWTLLYDSSFSSESNLRVGGTIAYGTFHFDNALPPLERLRGAIVTKKYSKPGVENVTLIVRDNALQANSEQTTITIEDGAPPVAVVGGPYQAEVGSFINFNGTGSTDDNEIQQYHWTFGDTTGGPTGADLPYIGKGAAPRHFYKEAGTYDVELMVIDNTLKTHKEKTTVEVVVANVPTASASVIGQGAANGPPVYFESKNSSDDFGIVEYRWDFDDTVDRDGDGDFTNDIDAVGPRPFHTFSSPTGQLIDETFSEPEINSQTWSNTAGFVIDDGHLTTTGTVSWTTRGFYSKATIGREISVFGQVRAGTASSQNMMWGVYKESPSSFSYTQMPHALYFVSGNLNIYEDGSSRGQVGTYTRDILYDVRIDLKTAGADYFIREAGTEVWTALTSYSSLNRSASVLRVGATTHRDTFDFDNFNVKGPDNHKVTLTVEDGAGQTSSNEILVDIAVNLAPDVITVPWVPHDLLVPHETFNGQSIRLKGIVRDADAKTYQWDFGDGTQSAVLNVTNKFDLSIAHTYPDVLSGTPFVATLKVWDSLGQMGQDNYNVVVKNKTLNTETNIAIDEGLWYLHQTQTRTTAEGYNTGYWTSNARASATASSLQAFEINGHLETVDPRIDPYQDNVQRGLRQLFRDLGKVTIAVQTYGEPDTNGNGFGLQTGVNSSGGQPIYQGGQVMDAIASSGSPLARAITGGDGINRRSYFDILTDMTDQFAWGQTEQGSGGAWRYSWNNSIDNSSAQWGAIGILAAQDVFGIPVSQWVKDRNQVWLNKSYSGIGWGYISGTSSAGTPSGLVQMVLDDQTTSDTRWQTAEKWIADTWDTQYIINENNRPYYQYYAVAKSMRLAKPAAVTKFTSNDFDWFSDPTKGLARTLVDDQLTTGQFPGTTWITKQLRSAWGVIILSQSLFVQPPVADAGRSRVWAVDLPLEFDGSNSFHLDPFRSIVKYEWDFDNDGNYDFSSDKPEAIHTYLLSKYPEASLPKTIQAQLRVTDNNIPPLTDRDEVEIIIAIPPHPPIADAGDSYICTQGVPCQLDGSNSFDIDPTDFITRYEWELDNVFPFNFNEATGAKPIPVFSKLGSQNIGLRVWDNAVLNDVNNNDKQDEEEKLSDQHFILVNVVPNLPPIAEANGPYVVNEGSSIALDSTGTSDPNGDILEYNWDLDNDGAFDDAIGATPSFTGLDDGDFPITLEVSDTLLESTDIATITVRNVAPTVNAGDNQNVPEGTQVAFIGQFTDPGTQDTHSIKWDFGDGETAIGELTPNHIYPDNGIYTVTLTVTDDDGGIGEDTLEVNVENVNPQVEAGTDKTIIEGGSIVLPPSTFSDVGLLDTHTALINWGDGTAEESGVLVQGQGTGNVSASHTYLDNGTYTVTVKIKDDDQGEGTDSFSVTVNNARPIVEAGTDQVALTGGTINLDPASFTDAGLDDTHTATVDWGDGSGEQTATVNQGAGSGTVSGSHQYSTAGTYTVTVKVTDDDTGVGSDSLKVTVGQTNLPPTADAAGPYNVIEGGSVELSGLGSKDPEGQLLNYVWDLDNDGQYDDATGDIVNFIRVDDGIYPVKLQVSDGFLTDTVSTLVTVNNALPIVEAGTDQDGQTGEIINLDPASFTDAGLEDIHTAIIDWGDGSGDQTATVNQGAGSGTVPGSHQYSTAGTYTVTVKVIDDEGASGVDSLSITIKDIAIPPEQTIFDLYARAKDSKLDLVWAPVTGVESYNVYRSTTAGGPYSLIAANHNCDYCAYADFNLTNNTTYYYVVTSNKGGQESLSSNEAFATPKAATRTRTRTR